MARRPVKCETCGKVFQSFRHSDPCPHCAMGENMLPEVVKKEPPAPVQVIAHNVVIPIPAPAPRKPSRRFARFTPTAAQGGGSGVPVVAVVGICVVLAIGVFFFAIGRGGAAIMGPRLITIGDSSQKIILFSSPSVASLPVGAGEQGASCEVVESILVGGSARWYRVRVHGATGWTQAVIDTR